VNELFTSVIVLLTLIIQILIMINILTSNHLENIVAHHPFYKKRLLYGIVDRFDRGKFWKDIDCAGDHITILKYEQNKCTYEVKIIRCEEDIIGKKVLLAVDMGNPVRAVRYNFQNLYIDLDERKVGLRAINLFLCTGIVSCFLFLIVFDVAQIMWVIILILIGLNYLFLPCYLPFRLKTW